MADSITKIGKGAFQNCRGLESITLGANVKKIGKNAFKGCKRLKSITITSKKLTKESIKGSLKGSSVEKVVVKVGGAKANKACAKKYKKLFTAKVCGKKGVKVVAWKKAAR